MARWTKKAAIARMNENQKLQEAYVRYPLARVLVESAVKVRWYRCYNSISFHYAYKDWLWAATGHENEAFWTCISVIDDLLPPERGDCCIYENNPPLPGLPHRPEREPQNDEGARKFRLYTLDELMSDEEVQKRRNRRLKMREMLEAVVQSQKKEGEA